MMMNFADMQKLGQTNMETSMKLMGEWNKGWQAIAAEMSDYTKRSVEDGTAAIDKVLSSKSVEKAAEIQSDFAKRAYEDYMSQLNKIGTMYADLAKEAYQPMERAMRKAK